MLDIALISILSTVILTVTGWILNNCLQRRQNERLARKEMYKEMLTQFYSPLIIKLVCIIDYLERLYNINQCAENNEQLNKLIHETCVILNTKMGLAVPRLRLINVVNSFFKNISKGKIEGKPSKYLKINELQQLLEVIEIRYRIINRKYKTLVGISFQNEEKEYKVIAKKYLREDSKFRNILDITTTKIKWYNRVFSFLKNKNNNNNSDIGNNISRAISSSRNHDINIHSRSRTESSSIDYNDDDDNIEEDHLSVISENYNDNNNDNDDNNSDVDDNDNVDEISIDINNINNQQQNNAAKIIQNNWQKYIKK
jgi:hypothetical protein